jgi:hypothetical protein
MLLFIGKEGEAIGKVPDIPSLEQLNHQYTAYKHTERKTRGIYTHTHNAHRRRIKDVKYEL